MSVKLLKGRYTATDSHSTDLVGAVRQHEVARFREEQAVLKEAQMHS